MGRNWDKENKFKYVLSRCAGVSIDQIDELLDSLLESADNEPVLCLMDYIFQMVSLNLIQYLTHQ